MLRALPKGGITQRRDNRSATGIFVTRLVPKTTARSIEESIEYDTGLKLRAEQLSTKFPTYRSFFIRCDSRAQKKLLDPNIWPKDALIKQYFE
jgi:hypothetical protein